MLKNLLLTTISLIVALTLAEVTLRVFVPVRNIGASFSIYDETYGKKLKPSFSTSRITPEFSMQLTTNSLGFRGPEPEEFPHRPLLFLGDSMTMGYGVNDGQEFPALIMKALKNQGIAIPVVNAGIGDTGNGRWLKFLRSEGQNYDPRMIILALMGNDFSDNVSEHIFDLTADKDLRELPIPPPGPARYLQDIIETVPGLTDTYLVGFARDILSYFSRYEHVDEAKFKKAANAFHDLLTYRIVEETLALTRSKDWSVFAITIEIERQRRESLNGIFKQYGVPWINMPSKKVRPEFYYFQDGHWNALGHARAATLIIDWLIATKQEWLPEHN